MDYFLAFSFDTRLTRSEVKETTVRNVTGSFDRDPAILSDCFPSSVRLQLMRAMAPSWKPVGKPPLSSCVGSKNNLLCKFPEIGFGYLLCWFTYLQWLGSNTLLTRLATSLSVWLSLRVSLFPPMLLFISLTPSFQTSLYFYQNESFPLCVFKAVLFSSLWGVRPRRTKRTRKRVKTHSLKLVRQTKKEIK